MVAPSSLKSQDRIFKTWAENENLVSLMGKWKLKHIKLPIAAALTVSSLIRYHVLVVA